jgi:protein phosphatase 1 regulatory subunit 7
VQNKLRKIEGLAGLTRLRTLDLGANRIRVRLLQKISLAAVVLLSFCTYRQVIEGLENCTALNSLWLGKNKIETVDGLETLVNLKQLDIQNNRLTSLGTGLQHLHQLQELYLACNGLPNVEGLPTVSQLQTIGARPVDFYFVVIIYLMNMHIYRFFNESDHERTWSRAYSDAAGIVDDIQSAEDI